VASYVGHPFAQALILGAEHRGAPQREDVRDGGSAADHVEGLEADMRAELDDRLAHGGTGRGLQEPFTRLNIEFITGQDHEIGDDAPVLVGIDGSPGSEAAAALAFDEASRRRLPLVALHAWSDVGVFPILGMDWRDYRDEGEEVLGERLAGWQEIYPDVQVRRRLVCDVPARWLVNESETAQLVVLGSRGRGGFDGLHVGSVSSAVAQSARVPVIVVRSGD
jgi:nucleotide-binding universal stress UspA family protein